MATSPRSLPVQRAARAAFGREQRPCPTAFVAMPLKPAKMRVVYDDFIRPAAKACHLRCRRADGMYWPRDIVMDRIVMEIRRGALVIADLTGQNPKVLYEVSIAHALGTPVVLLSQSTSDVPFDLRHRAITIYEYTPRCCKHLERALIRRLRALIHDTPEP